VLYDIERDPVNLAFANLTPNDISFTESTTTLNSLDFLSNGFKCRNTSSTSDVNQDGDLMAYIAFAENPFKLARAR
jgi:ABC-type microcin C transport system permease subunit YejE